MEIIIAISKILVINYISLPSVTCKPLNETIYMKRSPNTWHFENRNLSISYPQTIVAPSTIITSINGMWYG